MTSLAAGRRNFRIACFSPGPNEDLEALVSRHHPRLLVVDVEWCARIGLPAIKRLHRHLPRRVLQWLYATLLCGPPTAN